MTPEEVRYGKKWVKLNCHLTKKDIIFIKEALEALKQASEIKNKEWCAASTIITWQELSRF
jgi:hypothetical protein